MDKKKSCSDLSRSQEPSLLGCSAVLEVALEASSSRNPVLQVQAAPDWLLETPLLPQAAYLSLAHSFPYMVENSASRYFASSGLWGLTRTHLFLLCQAKPNMIFLSTLLIEE